MSKPQHLIEHTQPSRLSYFPGCNTSISGMLWDRHLQTLRILETQATKLGLWEIAYEFSMLIGMHVAAQLRAEMENKNGS